MEEIVTVWSKFSNWLKEPAGAPVNKWFQGTSNADTLNAGITGVFSALGTLATGITTSKLMGYYQQQEKYYIQNAEEQARRVQLKGDIALRNLQIKHELVQGKQELAAAAGGGRLSGSNLDMLARDYRVAVMDERTSSLQTLWEMDNTRRAGYVQAINVAGQAAALAYKTRNYALAALGRGLSAMVKDLAADAKTNMQTKYQADVEKYRHTMTMNALDKYYGKGLSVTGGKVGTGVTESTGLAPEEESIMGPNPYDPSNNLGLGQVEPGLFYNGPLPDIRVNEDGSSIVNFFQ